MTYVFVYNLGIFSDFFHWVSETVSTIVSTFSNTFTGLIYLVRYISSGYSWFYNVTSVLPAFFGTLIALGSTALLIKFVLGR